MSNPIQIKGKLGGGILRRGIVATRRSWPELIGTQIIQLSLEVTENDKRFQTHMGGRISKPRHGAMTANLTISRRVDALSTQCLRPFCIW